MAKTVNLDAMIPRADFSEVQDNNNQAEQIQTLNLSQLKPDSFLVPSLRKPDFQRETTQWSPIQIITFLKSFLDNELVPSIILWKSPEKLFVIDGAHRVSALLAWINDDYGDGKISKKFFSGNITDEQIKTAELVRKQVNKEIGSFTQLQDVMFDLTLAGENRLLHTRASNARTRALSLQWVEGDALKAETSFFKINKQGTPLDKTEERLLRERSKPIAIAARSIMRAGAGHKYWSKFEDLVSNEIEELSKVLNSQLFSPEIAYPVKTLNLPHGGRSSPITAYNLLMDMIALIVVGDTNDRIDSYIYKDDKDGLSTIRALRACIQVMQLMTGNGPSSLGLHPAVFFYNSNGRHMDAIFLGAVSAFAKATRDNNKNYFSSFTKRRQFIEKVFLKNKSLFNQANSAIYSGKRVPTWSDFFTKCVNEEFLSENCTAEDLLESLNLKGKIIASDVQEFGSSFSDSTKSAVFLADSLENAQKCSLCGGLVQVEKSVAYDHKVPKSLGGTGSIENIQITHPYCNSIKGSEI